MNHIYFFYHSSVETLQAQRTIDLLVSYCDENNVEFTAVDMKLISYQALKKYIQQFGVLTQPTLCINNKIVTRDYLFSHQQILDFISYFSSLPCQSSAVSVFDSVSS